MIVPPLATGTSTSSSGGMLFARGGANSMHSNRCGSEQRSGHQGGVLQQTVVIDLPTPPGNYQTVIPPQPNPRGPGFRGRVGSGVSGAAAAAIDEEFEVPDIPIPVGEAFGRAFHQTSQGESSVISGLSGGTTAASGMSGISALTDAFSSISNSDVNYSEMRAARQVMRLNRARQNWDTAVGASSDNPATDQMLNESNGSGRRGSYLNNSAAVLA